MTRLTELRPTSNKTCSYLLRSRSYTFIWEQPENSALRSCARASEPLEALEIPSSSRPSTSRPKPFGRDKISASGVFGVGASAGIVRGFFHNSSLERPLQSRAVRPRRRSRRDHARTDVVAGQTSSPRWNSYRRETVRPIHAKPMAITLSCLSISWLCLSIAGFQDGKSAAEIILIRFGMQ